jgi:hypothetical protein
MKSYQQSPAVPNKVRPPSPATISFDLRLVEQKPLEIVVRVSYPDPIRLKLMFDILNLITDNEIITEEILFTADSPVHTVLTPLLSDDLLVPQKGWANPDRMALEITITHPDPESRPMFGPVGSFRAQWTTRNGTCLTALPGASRTCGHLRYATFGATIWTEYPTGDFCSEVVSCIFVMPVRKPDQAGGPGSRRSHPDRR